jgi:hypothetical protein
LPICYSIGEKPVRPPLGIIGEVTTEPGNKTRKPQRRKGRKERHKTKNMVRFKSFTQKSLSWFSLRLCGKKVFIFSTVNHQLKETS